MGGWKTWLGAGMIVVSGIVTYFGFGEIGGVLLSSGLGMAGIGIGHKIEKAMQAVSDATAVTAKAIAIQNPQEPPKP